MEERVSPPKRHKHRQSRGTFSSYDDSFDYTSASKPVGSCDGLSVSREQGEEESESNTYVVQVPKDQIYRVPPPENAKIEERYRDPATKRKISCCTPVGWIMIILFVIGFSTGATVVVLRKVYSPEDAVFSIVDAHVRNESRPSYGFTIKVKNPNKNVGIKFDKNGDASLFFGEKKLATGKFPELEQEKGKSTKVQIALTGSNKGVPAEVSQSMHDKKKEHAVKLELIMNLKGGMTLGFLKLCSKDMDVVCNFKVSTLRTGTHVLSQKCETGTN